MKNAKQNTEGIRHGAQPVGMPLVALAHALNLLQAAGYPVTATDTPDGVTVAIAGIHTRVTDGGRVAFQTATTADPVNSLDG